MEIGIGNRLDDTSGNGAIHPASLHGMDRNPTIEGAKMKDLKHYLLEHVATRRIDRIMDAAVLFMFGCALVAAVLRFR